MTVWWFGTGRRAGVLVLTMSKHALVLGHAVPMPMMVRTRKYDPVFYAAIGADTQDLVTARARRYDEIFGSDDE